MNNERNYNETASNKISVTNLQKRMMNDDLRREMRMHAS